MADSSTGSSTGSRGPDCLDETGPKKHGRRNFLAGATALAAGGLGLNLLRERDESGFRADVVIARAASYEEDLARIVGEGLAELGLGRNSVRGKSILLKPNLVEPSAEAPQINTHPLLVRGVVEAFRRWDAREVLVAEGQGHCRDSDLVLEQSGLAPLLDEGRIEFVDLNHDEVFAEPNRLRYTRLREIQLPRTLRRADLIVSMPKMKTHHWAGVTLAMKNLFGVMPGVCYGWPKNVLHREGIHESILDINAAVRPHLAIVDGIVGMEGDGPIMGTPRAAGVLVMGSNLPAVDATAARLMAINPRRIAYLAAASGRLGPIAEGHIRQRGEAIAGLAQRFALLDHPSFAGLRLD
jgi:uncharacterized protein (DUF362 family)